MTFIAARITVFLIMSRRLPDLYLYVGETHVHHLNHGIFLLAIVGAYLLLDRPEGQKLTVLAALYGIGLALTFDEFGMWLHLGGSYWQRASWDAVGVLAAGLGLLAYGPSLRPLRLRHWLSAFILLIGAVLFYSLLAESLRFAGKVVGPKLLEIEQQAPP